MTWEGIRLVTRRHIVVVLGASGLAPFISFAQLTRKIPLVGVLYPGPAPTSLPTYGLAALSKGLREIGYVEGRTIALEFRYADGKTESLPALAIELVKLKVDVLVTIGAAATKAAKAATGTIPIVATDTQTDPVASGLVTSLAMPGGNITGLFLELDELMGKLLELLTETAPGLRRIAVLWDTATGRFRLDGLTAAAKKRSVTLDLVELKEQTALETVLNAALKKRPQALIQLPSPVVSQVSARTARFTLANSLPSISIFPLFPEAGGLMSYGPDLPVYFGRLAPMVDKILKGAKPGEIPIERAVTFEMVLNMKTAKSLGLKIPNSILVQATRVIK